MAMSVGSQNKIHDLSNFGRSTSKEKIEYLSRSDTQVIYSVDLSSINIKDIPDLTKYKHCKSIDLSCNHISSVWHEVFLSCSHLKEIKLYSNHLTEINGMKGLHHLENLQLQFNKIKAIGSSLKDCRTLKLLRLDSNMILDLKISELNSLRQLSYLDISCNKIDDITAVCSLVNLQELHCSRNNLTCLPDMSVLKKLQEIDFSFNSLTSLKGLKGMLNLSILCVKNNSLASLSSLKCMKSLTDLDVSYNNLQKLNNFPKQFPNIEILNVAYNAVESLEEVESLKECIHLKEVDIQANPIVNNVNILKDLKTTLTELNLELVNGRYMKRRDTQRPSSAAAMRPMTANQLVSERMISDQLQYDSMRLGDFEERLKLQFAGIQGLLDELPKEKPSHSKVATKHIEVNERPQSRCSSRHRIAEARAFSENAFRTGSSK